jgi:hypothetical protein
MWIPLSTFFPFFLDSFIDALVADTSRYHEFAHFSNEWPPFYDRFNSRAMALFEVTVLTVAESGVYITKEYVLGKLYTMESYLDMPTIPKEEGEKESAKVQGERH